MKCFSEVCKNDCHTHFFWHIITRMAVYCKTFPSACNAHSQYTHKHAKKITSDGFQQQYVCMLFEIAEFIIYGNEIFIVFQKKLILDEFVDFYYFPVCCELCSAVFVAFI